MIKANILAGENTLLSTVFSPYDLLTQAGIFWNSLIDTPTTPMFDIKISSVDAREITGLNGAKIQPQRAIDYNDELDLIIVPSEGMHIQINSDSFQQRAAYLKAMHAKGTVLASVCTGAFLIAATGILNNKLATTHWALAEQFVALFPEVTLNTDLLIADQQDVITSGGVSADQDLGMHLIKRFCGLEAAMQSSRCTLIPVSSRSQNPYKTFIVNKKHSDQNILKCQQYIEDNLNQPLSIDLLSALFLISQRTLNRRFKQATGKTVIHYIQHLRIEKAKRILECETHSFDSIANQLGYENISFFRRLFKKQVGITPKEYRKIFVNSDV